MWNNNFNSSNHCVIFDSCICTRSFFYCVVVSLTKIIATEFKGLEDNLTSSVILHAFNFNAVFLQYEFEFVSLKFTTFQTFSEVHFNWNWNTINTFLCWLFWFFNCLAYWVVNVNCLVGCIFNISTSFNRFFHSCWNIKFIVTSKGELSSIDNRVVYFIFDKFIFWSCSDCTVFNFDVEFSSHICTSYWIVGFDIRCVNVQFICVVCIRYTNVLDVVSFCEFSSIKPYLVYQFRTAFNSLSIQVFWFVVCNTINIWIRICCCVLVTRDIIVVIHQLVTSDVIFLFRNDKFFWLEFRSFWRSDFVVEFFICSTVSSVTISVYTTSWCNVCNSSQCVTVLSNFNCHCSFHLIVSHSEFFVFRNHFFYSVSVCTNFSIVEWQFWEGYVTSSIIFNCFNDVTSSIFQYEAKFTSFKFTTCQFLSEVKLSYNWRNYIVVELCVFRHCNSSTQETCSSIFSNFNFHFCVHSIVIDVCIVTSFFTHSVSVFTFSTVFNSIKCDWTICCIFLSLNNVAVFKQFECEGTCCKLFTFKTFSELELSLSWSWCECIVEFCISWKSCYSSKRMTWLSNSNCYVSFHWVISHTCFRTLNFFYSVLVVTNLSICKCQGIETNTSASIILFCLKDFTIFVFQYEAKFASFQVTTCKSFAEVKLSSYRSYNVVVEDLVISTSCFTTCWSHFSLSSQKTCSSIFSNRYFNCDSHFIVVYIGIVAFHFFNSVVVDTFMVKWQFAKVNLTVSFIGYSFINIVITSQREAKVTCVQSTIWKWFIKVKVNFNRTWCECVIEFCICWKNVSCFKNVAFLSNSDCYFSFHCIVSHTSFFIIWDNFFYSILVSTNLSIIKCQVIKGNNTISAVFLGLKNITSWIFKSKCKFAFFKSTTWKSLTKVELSLNWSYNVVIENFIICTWFESTFSTVFNWSLQITSSIFLSYSNCHCNSHCIIIDVCIWAFNLSNCVSVYSSFVKC